MKRINTYISTPENKGKISSLSKAFISYSHADGTSYVEHIIDVLFAQDFAVWADENLIVGEEFDPEIEGAIRECDVFILMASDNSLNSPYIIEKELKWANKYGKPVFPIIQPDSDSSMQSLSKRVCDLLSDDVTCLEFSMSDSFADRLVKSISTYIISLDLRKEILQAIKEKKHERPQDWPLHDRYLVALAYTRGIGLERDIPCGVELLEHIISSPRRNMDKDDICTVSSAQMEMGSMFLKKKHSKEGTGSLEQGLKYYSDALDNGNGEAGIILAEIYAQGHYGVKKDTTYALLMAERAAELDYVSAMVFIAQRSSYCKEKIHTAIEWFERAAEQNDTFSMGELGKIYRDGKCGVPVDGAKAIEWFEKAAERNDTFAMGELGGIYRDGKCGTPVDGAKAIEWFEKAAKKNDTFAMIKLGEIYRDGKCGTPVDGTKAIEWFEKSAKKNDTFAMNELGKIYCDGLCGIPVDGAKAVEWFERSTKRNNTFAMNRLGEIYRDGLCGIPVDGAKAIKWFEKAAKRNDTFAMNVLGKIYRDGLCGVPADGAKAIE